MNDKINAKHLERAAYVYIRQSSLQQVRQNLESGRRQYALQDRARELGFAEVVVIDEDLGISGAGHHERPGFGRLLAAVCDGRVGAVLAMEASRLARNNRDWHHLIDLCVLTQTLVVDAEGIYDPRLLNDRLLLGLKGTMSEFELGILRQRAQEAYRQKVLRGEVLTIVPIGFIRSHSNRVEMTPDREVQEAVRRVFSDFERFRTLRQVLLWYHQENITIPLARAGEGRPPTVWRLPNYQHLLRMLKNPSYAGAFAYGRTECQTVVMEGRSRKRRGHRVAMENWQVLLKDHHPGYISWEQYLENQRILKSNRTKSHDVSSEKAQKENLNPSDRHLLRLEKAKPLLEQIKIAIQAVRGDALPKSALAKACNYTLTLWQRLIRFLENPLLELSNNLAENAIRPVALGRKNWIHIGSKEAGPRVAAIISWSKLAGALKSPSATIWAQSCPGWAIFQSAESAS